MEPQVLSPTKSTSLDDARIKGVPQSAFYISDFITPEEEQMLLNKIEATPKPRWKQLSKRRLQIWPSDLSKNNTLLESPLPEWLVKPVITRLLSIPISKDDPQIHIFSDSPHKAPNLVLINEYLAGQGIMPHKDGSAYHPVVCTVSLGSSLSLDLYGTNEDGTRETEPRWKVLQEPRSLLITTGELYTDFMHGIANVSEDVDLNPDTVCNWDLLRSPHDFKHGHNERKTRVSLTYRDVLKVSKLGGQLGIFGKH
ncbi:alkylated DNA repair protein-like protein alkB 6 [Cadophora sp. MPI-SDFR-AT-0126]|nr:alkylated DNA repair protein-like protein alkB 6 [Leotiomycetes sp. MPI-SDFR-AT-0126]